MTPCYVRQRGETIIIAVADSAAVPGGEALVTCRMRAFLPGRRSIDPAQPVAATFVVSYREAADPFPAGWWLTLDAATCFDVAAGRYQIDLKIDTGPGTVTKTEPSVIEIREPATL